MQNMVTKNSIGECFAAQGKDKTGPGRARREALRGVLGKRGKRAFISGEQGNKGKLLRGTGEQRQYWGTGMIRKQIFDFLGTGEHANLFQGNSGTGTPPGGPQEGGGGRVGYGMIRHCLAGRSSMLCCELWRSRQTMTWRNKALPENTGFLHGVAVVGIVRQDSTGECVARQSKGKVGPVQCTGVW